MFLSRLELNPKIKEVRRDLASIYEMHSTLCRVFADQEKSRVLWRIEDFQTISHPVVLVQSEVEPDWSALTVPEYFLRPPSFKEYTFPRQIKDGQRLRFRVHANPIVTQTAEDKPNDRGQFKKRRTAILNRDDLLRWIERQGEILPSRRTGGFNLLSASVTKVEKYSIKKRKDDREYTLFGATFEGILEVKSIEHFLPALQSGIGKGKAFGLGMLSVAPI